MAGLWGPLLPHTCPKDMNKFQQVPGREGFHRVLRGRALHWPSQDGKPMIWARAGEVVDLRSPYLCEIAQKTGQYHKLEKVEEVPADAALIGIDDIPHEIRSRLQEYEAGKPADSPQRFTEPARQIDFSALPSAAPEPEAKPKPKRKAKAKAPAQESPPEPPADLAYEPKPEEPSDD